MTRSERKEREKLRRQESIIDSAEELIRQKGFDSVTMDEIADMAELSKGALYLYFENKMAIHLAICERGSRLLNRRFSTILTEPVSGLEMIRKMGEEYLRFVQKNPVYFQSFIRYENILDESYLAASEIAQRCEENSRQALAYIGRTLQAGMQDGSIDDSYDPQELAVLIWACSRGVVLMTQVRDSGHHYRMLDEMNLDMESMITSLLRLLESGMAKSGGEDRIDKD